MNIKSGFTNWISPSNIALVKYWGKKENQIPINPSISLTLNNCHSKTKVSYSKSKKGINVPDQVLPLTALSKKDLSDLEFVCDLGIEWLGLSFVQRAKDVKEAKRIVRGRAAILSKIEK